MTLVLGVDPGAAATGLVLADVGMSGSASALRLQDWKVVKRSADMTLSDYVRAVLLAADLLGGYLSASLLAVEDVTPPNVWHEGKRQVLKPDYLIPMSAALGAFIAWAQYEGVPCVLVPPGHNGSGPLSAYPPELVGPREKGLTGTGILNHCRSAWDVAKQGERMARARV
jgi:hypothetical protein